ncbi:MAG: response regulator [Spirochaetaceae bacterium]|nr:response regulator [Spirochaetaceae bacterium]
MTMHTPSSGASVADGAGRGPASERPRILIVDDEPTYREYLERFLSRDGLEVRTAETGAEAIALSRDFAPDLLLADWMLRCEMHGIEVGEALRNRWPGLRILLMTGFPTADLEAEAARVGIDGFLEKPFALDDLSRAITAALAGRGAGGGTAGPATAARAEDPAR